MRHHGRPWKCGFPGCEFAEGGFLSRKMRDEHLDRFHQSKEEMNPVALENPDADEIQPLLFDLVSADKVASVRSLLPQFLELPVEVKDEIFHLVASSGSSDMLDLIFHARPKHFLPSTFILEMTRRSCRTFNPETFQYLLLKLCSFATWTFHPFAIILPEVLRSDSDDIQAEWIKRVNFREQPIDNKVPRAAFFIAPDIIRATESRPHREEFLLQIWKKLDLPNSRGETYVGDALVNVASTTCSIKLASFLLKRGTHVDHRRTPYCLSPLQHAARKISLEAAKLMKFLLVKGANPNITRDKRRANRMQQSPVVLRIQDEKGAKEISKWLGMSWDELLACVQEERQKEQANDREKTSSSDGKGRSADNTIQ